MADVALLKKGAVFSNAVEKISVVWDFAVDGGATGALNLLLASEDLVIVDGWMKVKTLCTSGGAATVEVGIAGGDTDAVIASTAVAALTAGSLHMGVDATLPVKLADGAYLALTIGTAALTAGKIEFEFLVAKF